MAHTNEASGDRIPVGCRLAADDALAQLGEWEQLRDSARSIAVLDSGVRMTFPASLADTVDDLAARESACCPFLSIEVTTSDDSIELEMTAASDDAHAVISAIAGDEAR